MTAPVMKPIRKFPSWLPRSLESLVFSVFALLWTASLSGCQKVDSAGSGNGTSGATQTTDSAKPKSHDTVYVTGTSQPVDTAAPKPVAPTSKDSAPTKYEAVKPDPIRVRYGVFMPDTRPDDRMMAKYGVLQRKDTGSTSYRSPAPQSTATGEAKA
jgi:hypothetical protein